MEYEEKLICRICLETSKDGLGIFDETVHNSLNLLLLNLDLGISHEPLVCTTCIDSIEKCVDFKTGCLYKRGSTFVECKDVIATPELCLMERPMMDVGAGDKCCFCMDSIDDKQFVCLKNEENDITELLDKYFPEFINGFSVTMNSMVCMPCYQMLQNFLAFISNCLTVEEKIMKYCHVEGTNAKGQVNLSSVVCFLSKDHLQKNHGSFYGTDQEQDCEWKNIGDNVKIESEASIEIDDQKDLCIKNEEVKIEEEENDNDRFDVLQSSQVQSTPKVHECELCMYQSTSKRNFMRHMVTHKSTSEVTTFICEICGYQTKYEYCLRKHVLMHKSSSEVETYKCEMCDFTTKYKDSLRKHVVIHKSSSEVAVFKCEMCTFQSKYKNGIRAHVLTHKTASELAVYKCKACLFETKYKTSLHRHMSIHQPFSKMHKCEFSEKCKFRARYRCELRKHNIETHSNSSEVKLYKCELSETCGFETNYKHSLLRHKINHKNESEVRVYKCEVCEFKTKHKSYLRKHEVIHKTIFYNCELCEFGSKHKCSLVAHMLVHKDAGEVTMYSCEMCTYQTKHKQAVRRHMRMKKHYKGEMH